MRELLDIDPKKCHHWEQYPIQNIETKYWHFYRRSSKSFNLSTCNSADQMKLADITPVFKKKTPFKKKTKDL